MNALKMEPQFRTESILELQVNNHPGVMSHICGLFSRRAYNLEGIVVVPIGKGSVSRMWLKVIEENNLDQIVKQLQKLPDVKTITRHPPGDSIFSEINHFFAA